MSFTTPVSTGKTTDNKEHQISGDGMKIAHTIDSQSLSHSLSINNALSSSQLLLLLVSKWYTFSLMSVGSFLLCHPAC